MIQIENVSRRGFLKGMLGTGALVLSVQILPERVLGATVSAGEDPMAKARLA